MGDKYFTLSELNLEGQLLGFVGGEPGKYKYLQLAVPTGNVEIKLSKELRRSLSLSLVPGQQIRVYGHSKLDSHTSKIKIKAYRVIPIDGYPNQDLPPQPKARIMVCQKSGCLKRGGKELLSELEKTLGDRNLLDKVTIEYTSCQKCCSSAPNWVLEIGNKKYKNISTNAIASLLESHLTE
ncbi:(2Fe-2S) ferredoxin domain-containing protein [Nostoc sp.]|uniref:(2Fe-2S) ferredoxin domain-containing protein n=1 Tax=Nostoc sp. TaxID=1180 RepID=UPI003593DE11